MKKSVKKLTIIIALVLLLVILLALIYVDNIIYYFNFEREHPDGIPVFDLAPDVLYPHWASILRYLENLALVKFTGLEHNFSQEERSEYCFEVVEWINGGKGESYISAYSSKQPHKAYGFAEYQLHFAKFKYVEGKEYLVYLPEDDEKYQMVSNFYCPMDAPQKSYFFNRYLVNDENMPKEFSGAELIAFVKELITFKTSEDDEYVYENEIGLYINPGRIEESNIDISIPGAPNNESPIDLIKKSPNIAYVKFSNKEHNFAYERRGEFNFEVVEWLHGGEGEENITLYSPKHQDYAWGEIEYYTDFKYEQGKEYLIVFDDDKQMPLMYLPVEDIKQAKYYNESAYDYFVSAGMSDPISLHGFKAFIQGVLNKS